MNNERAPSRHGSRSRRRRQSGYSLIEMIFVIGLLALFFTIVAGIFMMGTRALYASTDYTQEAARVDAAVVQLRADVWQARTLRVTSPQQLEITSMAGQQATWRWQTNDDEFGTLTRTVTAAAGADSAPAEDAADAVSTWRDLREPWRFERQGQSLQLHVGHANAAGRLQLTPQRVLLEGGGP